MADSFIIIDEPAVTDKRLDTEQLTVNSQVVQRERVQITGTAATDISPVSATDGLLVNLGANNDVTVTGSVTANAGTNLNTSALALEAGNLATIAGAIKAEDSAHASGHVGIQMLAVREATATDLSAGATDGDYEPLQVDASGRLHVNVGNTVTVGSHAVTNAGTFVVQENGSALTSLQLIDDTVFAEDAVANSGDKGIPALVVRRDAASAGAADGDYCNLSVDSNGALRVVGTFSGSTEYTEDAAAAADPVGGALILVRKDTPSTTVSTDGDNIAARGSNYGAIYVTMVDSSGNFVTGATQYTEDAAAASDPVGNALIAVRRDTLSTSEVSTDGDNIALKANSKGCLHVDAGQGVAHDAADAGNGVKISAKAETGLSGITVVADGDKTDLYAGADGVLIVREHTNLEDIVQERTTNTDGASTAFASGLAAPGAGIRLWITNVDICNSSASFCTVDLRDGSGGSVLWTLPVPATGGVVKTFNPPLKLTANTALAFDASAGTTTLTISANGFKSKL